MSLYKNVLEEFPELKSFYRFEGGGSFHHFNLSSDTILFDTLNYIYFSFSEEHHKYYIKKRLLQLINKEILKDTNITLNKNFAIVKYELFKEVIKAIENYQFDENMISIELHVSPLFYKLLKNNYIKNKRKPHLEQKIERVEAEKYKGGFGFSEDWLVVLTYFCTYQKITKDNLIEFLYAFRDNRLKTLPKKDLIGFLNNDANKRIIMNTSLYNDFTKYELMNSLQSIVEKTLYNPHSYLDGNSQNKIKKLTQEYSLEREQILESINRLS